MCVLLQHVSLDLCVSRSNRLDANASPSYVFAARPAASSPAYQSLAQAYAVLQELEQRLATLDQCRHSLQALQQQHQSLANHRARVHHIGRQLAELGGSGRGPVSPPPRAPALRGELAELQRTAQAWHYHDSSGPSHPTRQHSTSSTNSLASNGSNGTSSSRGATQDYASRAPSPRHSSRDGRDGSGSTGGGGGANRDPRLSPRGQARQASDHTHPHPTSDRRRPRDHSSRHDEPHKRHRR